MDAILTGKIVADIGVALSVVYLATKVFRGGISSSLSNKVATLEENLRELIQSSERSAATLEESLEKRQRNLDRTITELEAIESRVRALTEKGEKLIKAIDQASSKASSDLKEIAISAQKIIQKTQIEVNMANQRIELSEPIVKEEPPEPPSFSLSSRIEKQIEPSDLVEVERLAEDLLKAGRDIEYVAARTKLPVDRVEALHRANDPRLGALGAMRRMQQTL
jgi:hypothetical protein